MGQSIGNSSSPPSAGSYNRGGAMRDTGRDYRQFQGQPQQPMQQPQSMQYQTMQPQQQPQPFQQQYQPQQQQPQYQQPQQQYQPQYQPQQGYGRPMPQRGYGGGYGGGYGPPMRFGGYGQMQQPFGQMEQSFGPVSTGMSKMPDMPMDKISTGMQRFDFSKKAPTLQTVPQESEQPPTPMRDDNAEQNAINNHEQMTRPMAQGFPDILLDNGFNPQMLQSLMGNQQLMQALQGVMRGGGMQGNQNAGIKYTHDLNIRPTNNQPTTLANYG